VWPLRFWSWLRTRTLRVERERERIWLCVMSVGCASIITLEDESGMDVGGAHGSNFRGDSRSGGIATPA
jgi:hypothetical protein